jgi:phospholipid-binding lipoprotein MlaA
LAAFAGRAWRRPWTPEEEARALLAVDRVIDGGDAPLDALRAGSIDPYASLRSAYRQRRAAEIRNPAAAGDPAARGTGFGVGAGAQGTGPR